MVSTTDVAKYAGVSQTTVSRVLNKPDQVKRTTYDQVMRAVRELNYDAVEIEKKVAPLVKLTTIALIVDSLGDSVYLNAMPSIITTTQQQGYQVTIHFTTKKDELDMYELILSNNPAGIIVISTLLQQVSHEKLMQSTVPFVLLNSSSITSRHSISLNNIEAGYLATKYLIDARHEEIFWVGGTLSSPSTKDGLLGFVQAFQEAQFKVGKKHLIVTDLDKFSLFDVWKDLQGLPNKATAIVAATDEIAIQLMDFYQRAGYNIPQDISIMGIGNSAISEHSSLGLTSVGTSTSLANIGQETVKRLLDIVNNNQNEAFHVTKEVHVYERATTAIL
ncbi:LacI family DNA-binding transcriptional regulator [Planococcus versutus]|uniref:LacI family transcriptional regulator n=1 Tax=Planococcus versutus TaxID=1302659 RepID=A0A1B1S5Q7_9BACL|nr:LacI family DNA-binding transcriptional regulator [Planococcus versutus]ANU28532.1 LacI family transcriptional regulator [Planococcus versutus]